MTHTTKFARASMPLVSRWIAACAGLCISFCVFADTTSLTLAPASQNTGDVAATMDFPLTRSGDTGYATVLTYHTIDGTAVSPIDYAATSGSIILPAGSTSASIAIALGQGTHGDPDLFFQLALDSATGIGPPTSFSGPQVFAAGATTLGVAITDINGDGLPDVIVANAVDNTVSVLLNTSAPGATAVSFAAQQTFSVVPAFGCPRLLTAADVNGDGKPDLIATDACDYTVLVLLNTTIVGSATASFAPSMYFYTGYLPQMAAVIDINGDGRPDLVVPSYYNKMVSVLLNTMAPGATIPSFAAGQNFFIGDTEVASVAAADLNGDGKPDLILQNLYDAAYTEFAVLLNTTAPGAMTASFATPQLIPTPIFGTSTSSVSVGDFNGDGKPDVVTTDWAPNIGVTVWLNATPPGAAVASFATSVTFHMAAGSSPVRTAVADLNGDGKPDLLVLVVVYGGGSTVQVLLNTTAPGAMTPSFVEQQSYAVRTPYAVAAADLNGDGKPDIIVTNGGLGHGTTFEVLLNTTPASAAMAGFATPSSVGIGTAPSAATLIDTNGDGNPDLIVANESDGTVAVSLNTTAPGAASASFATPRTFAAGSFPHALASADLNGDGRPDLIVANRYAGTVSVLFDTTLPGDTHSSFSAAQAFATGEVAYAVAALDIDGDGRPDLVVANQGDNTVSVLLNLTPPGAATPSFARQQSFAVGAGPVAVAVADLNGDGRPDLVVTNNGDNTVSVLRNSAAPGAATASFDDQRVFAAGINPFGVTVADLNGDGKPDLVVANNDDDTVSVLFNTSVPGSSPDFAAQQAFDAGPTPYAVTSADIDGDGRPDLIVASNSEGVASVLFNTTAPGAASASFAAPRAFAAGSGAFSIAAADVNGDGRPDLVVANYFGDAVSVLLSTQYQSLIVGSPATGTIVNDPIFADGFE